MRPNELTVGGRHEVEAELRNMHKKILHAKSTINTRLDREYMAKLPSAAAARKSRPRSATQRAEDVQEAKREAARSQRLAARSGKQSFSAPPVSLHLASKLSENRRRRQHVTDRSAYEHERELYHLSRRIQSRCSITERKKNRFDADLNPVYLRRRTLPTPVTLSSLSSVPRRSSQKTHKAPLSNAVKEVTASPPRGGAHGTQRPQSARPTTARTKVRDAIQDESFSARPSTSATAAHDAPSSSAAGLMVASAEDKMYDFYRQMLLDKILQDSIYDEDSLRELFKDVVESNTHDAFAHVLESAIQDLSDYLNVYEAPVGAATLRTPFSRIHFVSKADLLSREAQVRGMAPPYGFGERATRGASCVTNRTVRFRCSLHNTIFDVLKYMDWIETEGEDEWDFFWADTAWIHEHLDHIHLQEHQRLNHFRNHYELTRKDLLIKNLKRMKKSLERDDRGIEASRYDFFPQTYAVPAEYNLFVEEFKRSGGVWIMKPVGKAQGKGIFLFNKLNQISEWKKDTRWSRPGDAASLQEKAENYIVQRYIERPYLIGGKKFDLRIYALVTAYAPLKVYLYRAGFARFSNSRFSMRKEDITNNYIHLTNVAIQKTASNYDSKTGGKWSIRNLKIFLQSRHGEEVVGELFNNIRMLIIRSLLAVQNVIIHDKHCFELYGYDIMIDEDLKPWLIEVNASPSLTADTNEDYSLKFSLLQDVLNIVDMDGSHRAANPDDRGRGRVGGFDLIWDGNAPHYPAGTSIRTMLGAATTIKPRVKGRNQT